MKFSYNWIRKYVDLPENLTMDRLSYDLTMRTVEVESAENLADNLENVVIGQILAILPHPGADKLRLCSVDIGLPEPVTIVCGGSNLVVDQLVAVAVPGARVRWHGEGELVEIKAAKLRGEMSHGMICAAGEIGLDSLFPSKDDHEIMDLSAFEAQPGQQVAAVLDLDDQILEIDNKSLTNRPDLWGHYGIARELAAIYQKPLNPLPQFKVPARTGTFPVIIDSPDLCNRYAAVVYSGLKNEASPYWLQLSLWKVGMRPINNLVDITNYVMLATGQPTHGFDKSHVESEIRVRKARRGEKLEMLDRKRLDLSEDDLMICDAVEPMSLAGIMGGKDDSILTDTTEMILELAKFNPLSIRHSSQRHGVRTEAGIRNEKGVDALRMDQAMGLADWLIHEIIPGAFISAFTDCWPVKPEQLQIQVPVDFLNVRLGRTLSADEIVSSLKPLGFSVEFNSQKNNTEAGQRQVLLVDVPSWRATGDISLPDDILEEIARMIGYENFSFIAPQITLDRAIRQRRVETERSIREYMAFRAGFQEIFTYPWIDQAMIEAAGIDREQCLQLSTPPSPETAHLRTSLIPGLLEAAAGNLRYFDQFKIFELTQVFNNGQTHPSEAAETLPLQERNLAAVLTGQDPVRLFREMKGILELMPRIVQVQPFSFGQRTQPTWADKKIWLNIIAEDQVIGSLGLLSAKSAHLADIKRTQVGIFELNLEFLQPLPSRENRYQPLPQFPLVEQDLSVVIDNKVKWDEIETLVSGMVRRCTFIEEYHGKQVPQGKKSVMFRVWLGSDAGTLTAQDIDQEMQRILKKLNKQLGAEIRQAENG